MPLKPELEKRLLDLAPDAAAEALLRGYGAEILSFLHATLRDPDDADEAFSMFSEDVWRGLGGFQRQASYRTWAYLIARNAAHRLRRGDGRRLKRFESGGDTAAERLAWEIRTTTAAFRRTAAKDKLRALRDALADDERELLTLRLDRGLGWNEIAVILEEDPARLRKRFERIKDRLRAMAERSGLVGS